MHEQSRKEFDEHIRASGIDPENPASEGQKLALCFAWSAWLTQQLKIDALEQRAYEFKRALHAL